MIQQLFALIFIVFLSSGCTVLVVGTASILGGTYYISGEIKKSYETSIYHLYESTLYSFQVDGIKVTSVQNTKTDADIEATLSDGRELKVHIFYNKEGYAVLGIRIGSIGDEKESRYLLKRIERYI